MLTSFSTIKTAPAEDLIPLLLLALLVIVALHLLRR